MVCSRPWEPCSCGSHSQPCARDEARLFHEAAGSGGNAPGLGSKDGDVEAALRASSFAGDPGSGCSFVPGVRCGAAAGSAGTMASAEDVSLTSMAACCLGAAGCSIAEGGMSSSADAGMGACLADLASLPSSGSGTAEADDRPTLGELLLVIALMVKLMRHRMIILLGSATKMTRTWSGSAIGAPVRLNRPDRRVVSQFRAQGSYWKRPLYLVKARAERALD
jgi:hypothetical protein